MGAASERGQSPYRLDIPADLSRVAEAREWVARIGRSVGLSDERVFDLQVVTSEAIANGIEHAASEVEVVAWTLPDRLVVEVTNDGVFQPGLYHDDEHRRRGLGLPMMVSLADRVHVSRLSGERTKVSLTFLLAGSGPASAPAAPPEYRAAAPAGRFGRLGLLLLLPVPLLVVAVGILHAVSGDPVAESVPLLTAFNALFVSAACIIVAYLAARTFLAGGSSAQLTLGAGSILLGLAYVIAGPLVSDANLSLTIHNSLLVLAGLLFCVTGVLVLGTKGPVERARGGRWLLLAYGCPLCLALAWSLLARAQLLPAFFVEGSGYTHVRESVLGLATVTFAVAAVLFVLVYRERPSRFALLLGASFALVAVAFGSLLLTGALPGSTTSWVTRAAQWTAGVYLLAGALSVEHGGAWLLPLERTLRESEARYGSLVALSPDAVFVHSAGRFMAANPAAARLLGFSSPDEVLGRSIEEFYHPSTREAQCQRVAEVYSGGMSPSCDEQFVRVDGSLADVMVFRTRVEYRGRLAVQTLARDVTESKKAEEALRESERRQRALAEENEKLYRQQLSIADSLQLSLLNVPSEMGPLRLGHLYRSATQTARVGGDFYDVFEVKNGKIAMLIGDVAGHGIEAARTATLVKDVVYAFAHQSLRTHEVLHRTNMLLIEKELAGFVTLFLGILDVHSGVLRYSSAGHPPTLVRRVSGQVEALGEGSTPLGIYPNATWKAGEVGLAPGDLLLLYTDGVTEAHKGDTLFGAKRLEQILRRKRISAERLPQLVLDRVLVFSDGLLSDDVALLALSLTLSPSD